MKIPVKDFKVFPVMCPANYKEGCAPCRYAKLTGVKNPPLSVQKQPFFGEVECTYLDHFQSDLERAIEKGNV